MADPIQRPQKTSGSRSFVAERNNGYPLIEAAEVDAELDNLVTVLNTGALPALPPIPDLSITTNLLANGAVTTPKLAPGAVTGPTVASNAIDGTHIQAGAVGNLHISDVAWVKLIGVPATFPPGGVAGGDLVGTFPNPTIGAARVTRAQIAADAWLVPVPTGGDPGKVLTVGAGPSLGWATLPAQPIADGSVTEPKLATGAVSSRALGDGQVTAAKLQAGVIPAQLPPVNGSVTAASMAPNAIGTSALQNNAVTLAKIDQNSVPLPPVPNAGNVGQVLQVIASPGPVIAWVDPPTGGGGGDTFWTDDGTALHPDPSSRNVALDTGALLQLGTASAWGGGDGNLNLSGAAISLRPGGSGVATVTPYEIAIGGTVRVSESTAPVPSDGAIQYTAANGFQGLRDGVWVDFEGGGGGGGGGLAYADLGKVTLSGSAPPTTPAFITGGSWPIGTLAGSYIMHLTIGLKIVDGDGSTPGSIRMQLRSGTPDANLYDMSPVAYSATSFNHFPEIMGVTAVVGPLAASMGTLRLYMAGDGVEPLWAQLVLISTASGGGGGGGAPTGPAGGALSGTYPDPGIAPNAITATELAALAVTDAKIADVAWTKVTGRPSSLPPSGAAGGGLAGTYPNPTLATNAVVTAAITNANVTRVKCATDCWLSPVPVGGDVGKVLTVAAGPTLAWSTPAGGPPTGAAGGSLSGTYPNPGIATGAVGATQLAALSATPAKFSPAAAAGDVGKMVTIASTTTVAYTAVPTSLPPSGSATGDLTGTYPAPTVGAAKITAPKLSPAPAGGDVGKMVTIAAGPALAYTVYDWQVNGSDSTLSPKVANQGLRWGGNAGTAKARVFESGNNGSAWSQNSTSGNSIDDTSQPAWEQGFSGPLDQWYLRRSIPGATAVWSTMLTCANNGLVTLGGATLQVTPRGGIGATETYTELWANAAGCVGFDSSKPIWLSRLDYVAEQFQVWRRAPSLGAWAMLFAVDAPGNLSIAGGVAIKATGTTWANPSDDRLKRHVAPYATGLTAILALEPIVFEYNGKGGSAEGMTGLGFSAQAVQTVMGEMVSTRAVKLDPDDEQDTDILVLDTTALPLALVNAVKELAARVDALESGKRSDP